MASRRSDKLPTLRGATMLAEQLRRLELLAPTQLSQLPGLCKHYQDDIQQLGRFLVKSGWLTRYQVEQVARGKGRDLFLGAYLLLELLGEGGMGQVFRARHRRQGRMVALKRIHPQHVENATAVRRFQREVRAASRLAHPNIVQTLDAVVVGGVLLLVMELVEGIDLSRHVRQNGAVAVPLALEILRQAALGLQHAHAQGLVHRDIKPHNLMLTPAGVVKVLDMGLARTDVNYQGESSNSTLTREGAVLGTVDFIAPEQAADARVADGRSDLYALGCTLYFLLAGQVPFPDGEPLTKLLKHRLEEPPPLEQFRPDVPAPLLAILSRLMAKEPEERCQNAAELLAALEQVPHSTAPLAIPVARAAPQSEPFADLYSDDGIVTTDAPARQRGRRQSRVGLYVVLALLMFVIGGLVAWVLLGNRHPAPPALTPKQSPRSAIREPKPSQAHLILWDRHSACILL